MNRVYQPDISYFAFSNFRTGSPLFGIWQDDRLFHSYIVGKTGAGKTNLLASHIVQDMWRGRGLCVLDIHGDLITNMLALVPEYRKSDLIYLDIPNPCMPYRYNPLKKVAYEKRSLVASGILECLKKLWSSAWGAKLEHILRYIILTLLDQDHATFSDVLRILSDRDFQKSCITKVINPHVKRFWQEEFGHYSSGSMLPLYNKVGAFIAHPSAKRLLIENQHDLSLRQCMDHGKILLVNLSKGAIGIDVAHLIASLLLNGIAHGSFSRIDTPEDQRRPFHLYLDEFHCYTTPTIAAMLSELRKFRVSLTLAHQYLRQLEPDIRHAVLGNVGTIICFRLGQHDALAMAHEFHPVVEASDFSNLENYDIYLKLMIQGKPSRPFSATTMSYHDLMTFMGFNACSSES